MPAGKRILARDPRVAQAFCGKLIPLIGQSKNETGSCPHELVAGNSPRVADSRNAGVGRGEDMERIAMIFTPFCASAVFSENHQIDITPTVQNTQASVSQSLPNRRCLCMVSFNEAGLSLPQHRPARAR